MSYIARPTLEDPCLCRLAHISAVEAIAKLETRLAAGARFAVLAANPSRLAPHDIHLLDQWHRAATPRMRALCIAWATIAPNDAQHGHRNPPAVPNAQSFTDPADAIAWLRHQLDRQRRVT